MMGVGLSAAILLDATLVRLVMLPAVLSCSASGPGGPTRPAGRAASGWSRPSRRTSWPVRAQMR